MIEGVALQMTGMIEGVALQMTGMIEGVVLQMTDRDDRRGCLTDDRQGW